MDSDQTGKEVKMSGGLHCPDCVIIENMFLLGPGHWINRGSYASAHILLNLSKELRKRDKMQGLKLYLSYDIKITFKSHFWLKKVIIALLCYYVRNSVTDVITFPVNL